MKTPITLLIIFFFLTPNLTYSQAPNLGTTSNFAVFTAVGAFDALGASVVTGDVGTNVGAFTGFPPGVLIGSIHVADPVSAQAAIDVASAYSDLVGITCVTVLGVTLGSGQILTPDVYCTGAATTLNGDLILDAQGDPNALFIFQIDGAFSTGVASQIILINAARLCNVYWQINGAFQLGDLSGFQGTVIANGAIHLLEASSVLGRVLSIAGAVDLHNNVVTVSASCSILAITCPPDVTIQCTESTLPANTGSVSVTDDCEPTPAIVYADVITSGACPQAYSIARTWTVSDICGNVEACTQMIEVIDTTAPIIIAGVIATCYPTAEDAEADAIAATSATDNCSGTIIYGASTVGTCSAVITVTATDECGNESSTIYTTRVDNSPPVITASGTTLSLGCNPSGAAIDSALGTATAADNCSVVTPTSTDGSVTGVCLVSQTRTFNAVDECGNPAVPVSRTVTWTLDTTIPVITATGTTLTLGCSPSAAAIDSALGTATATDDCGVGTPTSVDGPVTGAPCLLSQTRTFNVNDDCGNPAISVSRTVTWSLDSEAPVITATGSTLTLGCNPSAAAIDSALGTATATDNCTVGTPISTDGSITGVCQVSQTRTFNVTDACGNPAIPVSRTVTWTLDTTLPVITASGTTLTLGCSPSAAAIDSALGTATATDDCGVGTPTSVDGPVTGAPCLLSQTRTFNVNDDCGNPAISVSRTVTWSIDSEAPVITATGTTLALGCNPSGAELDAALGTATAADNCAVGSPIPSDGLVTGGPCLFSQTRTFNVNDDCGNPAIPVSRTVTWSADSEVPVITATGTTLTLGCNPSAAAIDSALGTATAEDNCTVGTPISSDGSITGVCLVSQTRTFNVSDECGNPALPVSRTVTWTLDTTLPVITASGTTLTLGCSPSAAAIDSALGTATATDDCGVGTPTSVDGPVTGAPCLLSQTRTFNVLDDCGNPAISVSRTVTWSIDSEAPVITATGTTLALGCNPSGAELDAALGTATAADNCAVGSPIPSDGLITGGPCLFSQTRTFNVNDDCGNPAIPVSRTVTWSADSEDPVITATGTTLTLGCNPSGAAIDSALGTATATDNCTVGTPISTDGSITGVCLVSQTRTFNVTDDCGNPAISVSRTVTWTLDTTLPVITASGTTLTLGCSPSAAAIDSALGTATASDDCGVGTPTSSDGPVTGAPCLLSQTRTFNVNDDCGNPAITVSRTVTWSVNSGAPVITCPTVISPIECGSIPFFGTATATDDCDLDVGITFVTDSIPGICGQTYILTRTWTATNDCGNTSQCSRTISVEDNTPPSITCPVDVTVECASLVPAPNPVGIGTADNCGGTVTVSFIGDVINNQLCPNRFTVTRTYRSTDECGNFADCNQIITVFDNTPPSITCPVDVTVQCASLVPAPNPAGIVTADNCGGTATVSFVGDVISNQSCLNRFTITRTYRSTDECGNFADCNQIITVFDNTPPSITCPVDVTVQCASLVPVPNPGGIVTADNCGGTATVSFVGDVISNQSCLNRFTITRTYRSTDECGNFVDCNQTITVFDNTPPSITCPVDVTVECASLVPSPNPAGIVTSDNCGGTAAVSFIGDVISNQACPNNFTLTRTYRSTDECGNFVDCNQIITVFDSTPPVITCPVDVTIQCASLVPAPNPAEIVTSDNCGGTAAVSFVGDVISNQSCLNRYTITRTYRSMDECENFAICNQIITVFDNTPPSITCPVDVTVQCASLVPAPNPVGIVTVDNCGGTATVSFVGDMISNQSCLNRYTITRTYRSTDECGNFADCNQIITVFDNTPPSITCPVNVTVQCASLVPAPNPVGIVTADNCGGTATVSFVGDVISNQSCLNRFTVTRTYRSTDECGNFTDCNQTIIVFDNTPPSIICPVNVTVQCASLVPAPNPVGIVTVDNCGGTATVSFVGDVISNQTCLNRFTVTRTYRSTDECGNFIDCNQTITVFDNTPPSITCPANLTVQCADQVPLPNPASVLTADNCGGTVTVTFIGDVIANLTCVNRFIVTRTYSANDGCGNISTCTQIITVFDNTPPVITFNDPNLEGVGDTLYVQCYGQDPDWNLPVFDINSINATDNCGGNVTVTFQEILVNEGNCSVDGYIILNQLTWTATDICGNSSTAFIFLALIDTIPPVIHGIPDHISVNCGDIPAPPTTVFATDECLCACLISFEETIPLQGCQDGLVIVRSWTATDRCGNVTTASQNITLIDVDGPVIEILQPEMTNVTDGTIFEYTCNDGGIPGFYDALGAWSVASPVTCGALPVITFNHEILVPNNCEIAGYLEQQTFHWEAIDNCGNISTFDIIVRLVDHEAPVLFRVPEMACIGDPSLDDVEAVDNCGTSHVRYFDVSIPNPCGTGMALRRTYEAYDDCGNMSQDTSILIPNDQINPSIKIVNPDIANLLSNGEVMTINCSNHNGNYTNFGPNDIEFLDGCAFGVSVNFSERLIKISDCAATGVVAEIALKWEVSDICGNVDSLIILANIIDESSPVFSAFKPEMTIGCNDKMPDMVATDNCGDVFMTIKDSIVSGPCAYEYTVFRTYVATDPCGNVTEAFQTIHVGNGSGPAIEGVIPEICDDLTIPVVTAYDACAGVFVDVLMSEDTLETTCRDGFVIQRTWSATDVCGHISQIIQIIIVGDTTPPVIMIPSYSVILNYLDILSNLVYLSQREIMDKLNALDDNSVFVQDDCDLQLIPEFTVQVDSTVNCETAGYKERRTYTWTATDICGNSSSISFTVDIMDDIPPVLINVPPDTTIVCLPLPLPALVSAEDISQPVSLVYSEIITAGEETGVFIVTRTWTATDACGNITVVVQHIKWIPNSQLSCEIILPPLIECNSHGVIVTSIVTDGFGPYTYDWQVVGEKCFIQSGQGTPEISIYVGWSSVTIILTVTDVYGCISICTVTYNCQESAGMDLSVFPNAAISLTDHDQSKLTPLVDELSEVGTYLKQINLWPNPANGTINLGFESTTESAVHFTLTDFLGQTVHTEQMNARIGMNTQKIDVTNLVEGSYLIQVKTKKEIHSKVVVILR